MTRPCPVCHHPYREQPLELGDLIGHDTLGHRIVMNLARGGILTREQLADAMSDETARGLPRCLGPKSIARIRHALKGTQ